MPSPDLLTRLASIDTAALCDADKSVRVMDAGMRPVTTFRLMLGRARTVRCWDDFLTVIRALEQSEPGEVLAIDGGGGRRALAGELFAMEAMRKKLAGIVIDGACRDTAKLTTFSLPMYARSISPNAGTVQRLGTTQVPVTCGGVNVAPGDLIVGDRDGIVVVSELEAAELLPRAEAVQRAEAEVMKRMEQGQSLIDMLNLAEHCAAVEEGRASKLRFQV